MYSHFNSTIELLLGSNRTLSFAPQVVFLVPCTETKPTDILTYVSLYTYIYKIYRHGNQTHDPRTSILGR